MLWDFRKPNLKNGISLCMIVKNEKNNPAGGIGSFLQHHLHLCDEVVLVDTGSTDNTKEIAREFGSQVGIFNYEWNNSFSDARNFSLEQANYDKILVLDADERLCVSSKKELEDFLLLEINKTCGYDFNFVNVLPNGTKLYDDCFITWWYAYRLRYFMNLGDLHFVGKVHEQIRSKNDNCYICKSNKLKSSFIVEHYLPSKKRIAKRKRFYESLKNLF